MFYKLVVFCLQTWGDIGVKSKDAIYFEVSVEQLECLPLDRIVF
jgi:hypothetical protein